VVCNVASKVLQAFANLVLHQCEEFFIEEFGIDLADAELWPCSRSAFYRVPYAGPGGGEAAEGERQAREGALCG
jgi:hypothetical protein